MKEYVVIYERAKRNWAAYAPDVPGCIATGKTRAEVERNFQEALAFHLEGLRQEGRFRQEGLRQEEVAAPRPRADGTLGEC